MNGCTSERADLRLYSGYDRFVVSGWVVNPTYVFHIVKLIGMGLTIFVLPSPLQFDLRPCHESYAQWRVHLAYISFFQLLVLVDTWLAMRRIDVLLLA